MLSLETAKKSLSDRSAILKEQMIKIFVRTPFSFTLYHDLALQGQAIPIPYLYTRTSWRCIIGTLSRDNVPIHVSPNNNGCHHYLAVRILCSVSTRDQREIEERSKQTFCADLNLSPFYERVSNDVKFLAIVRKLVGLKPVLSYGLFEALIKAVIRQLVHAGLARRSIAMVVARFGSKGVVNGEDYYGFPTPAVLAGATKAELMSCSVGYKWKLIKQLSCDITSGDLDLDELARLSADDVIQILNGYKGIGYWTSRIFLYEGLKRLDTYPIRDISLRKAISLIYFQGNPISWDEVEEFFRYYKDYVGIAANYLFGALWLQRSERLT